ncbi:MAG: NAD(P)/FAD-dependent oxidoreductase [Euryarchaeota archaeon]|nr:NAD(P)/FAD-dependent oxidoreductase [Euryarchaeota archaeon]
MRAEYDVIVVGAGPAGSTAARIAAKECDVLLVEKRQEIGEPVRCAEGVPLVKTPSVFHESFAHYVKPDPKWIASEVRAFRCITPDGTAVTISGEMLGVEEPLGLVLERKLFDRQLAKDAARAGVDVVTHTRATGLIRDDSVVRGVRFKRRGDEFEVHSKLTIGADGVESQVGRWGGINTTLRLKDIETCAQYHAANVEMPDDTLDFYFGSEAPSGYAWAFPKGDGSANIGLGVLGTKADAKKPIEYLKDFMKRHFPDGQPLELMVGGAPVSEGLATIVRDGLMLVGDAARHTQPVTGGGVIPALEGGTIAGTVACKAVRQNDVSTHVLREYETAWNARFGKSNKRSYKIKEAIINLSDEELNRIGRVFCDVRPEELNVRGLTKRLLKRDPRLMLMLRHLL